MSKPFKILLIVSVFVLTACAVPSNSELFSNTPEKNYSNMYLRGVFNWWEATDAFKFEYLNRETLFVEIELIADGQPYDFKVADDSWSPAFNCGLGKQGVAMNIDDQIELYCYSDSLNLQFVPAETAIYRFELDISNNQYPVLTIKATN